MERYKILIVDDEMPAREMIKGYTNWEETRFEICAEAKNGKEALAIVNSEPIDLIITDIQMPVMDGLDLIRELQACNYTGEVIVLSCHEEFRFAKEAMRHGVKEYLIKDLVSEMDFLEVLSSIEDELVKKIKVGLGTVEAERETLFRRELLRKLVIAPQTFDEMILCGSEVKSFFNLGKERHSLFVIWLDRYVEQYEELSLDQKKTVVRNAMDALTLVASRYGGEVFYNRKGEYILILGTPKTSSEMQYFKHCQERCNVIRKQLKAFGNYEVTIGISDQFKEIEDANNHYITARNACKYRVFLGGGRNIFYNTPFAQVHKAAPDMIEEKLQKVLSAMEKGDKRTMLYLLEEIYTDDFRGYMQYNYLRYVNSRLISGLFAYMEREMRSNEDVFGLPFIPVNHLDEMETTLEMLRFWQTLSTNLFDDAAVPNKNEIKYGLKVNQAIELLRENYIRGIGLQEIADKLDVHKVYLSRLFKKETDMTISHYVQRLKMEDAKKMLSETNMKIYDIAEKLGYNQSQQFSVTFKKVTGETPHGFRRQSKRK